MAASGRTEFFGYNDCIALENNTTRVVLGTSGGRVLEYALQGKNALMLDPAQAGWRYVPGQPVVEPSAGRCDVGPEQVIPRHPDLWFGDWQAEATGPRQARLSSVADAASGLQIVREFTLDAASSHLRMVQTITNVSTQVIDRCFWSRTFALGHGIVVMPLTEPSRFASKYVMYGPGGIDCWPQDPNIRVRDGFLEVLGPPQHAKLGMDTYAGWFGYLMRNDLMFVKRFPTFSDRVYNEVAGLTISIWYNGTEVCELEPIGPRERLAPGQSASFSEDWWLLPYAFPGDRVDAKAVAQLVGQQAR
ncbi:MAG: hypothetical protein IT369_22110 [Candidatus Latescibacteria bacterium]|nr:hypothetical protein [Candidatus Latescibacterota bacterium]